MCQFYLLAATKELLRGSSEIESVLRQRAPDFAIPFRRTETKVSLGRGLMKWSITAEQWSMKGLERKKSLKCLFTPKLIFSSKESSDFFQIFSDFLRFSQREMGREKIESLLWKKIFFLSRYDKIEDLALDFIIIHETSWLYTVRLHQM